MRPFRLAAAILLAALLVVPGAEAALNRPRPYEATYAYLPGLGGNQLTMASGALQASMPAASGSFGFFSTQGADITGLTRVCWTSVIRECADSAAGTLTIDIQPGGSFGLSVPGGAAATLHAEHALALFVDLGNNGDLNGLGLGKSLMAPLVDGSVQVLSIAPIPASALANPTSQDGGGVAAVDATTTIEVSDNGVQRALVRGKAADPVTFAGAPHVTPIQADLAILPFQGDAEARFVTAGRAAAIEGLDLARINGLFDEVYNANEGSPTQAKPINETAFGPFKDATAALFGGAVLSLSTTGNASEAARQLAFARTPTLTVRPVANGLSWTGRATLDFQGGHVQGAPQLYGWTVLSLPWWGWLLWGAALAVLTIRLALRPEKHHPVWDRFKWIGWVASPLVFLLVAWLWDLEVREVFGISLLSGHLSPQLSLAMLAIEGVTFAFLSFAAIAPLRMLLRNGSLLLRQGTFMGLSGAIASLLGYLIGFRVLLSELDLVVSQLLSHLPK